jgi:hypothetical protein
LRVLWPYPLLVLIGAAGRGLVLRLWAWPCTGPEPLGEPVPADAVGAGRTGPVDAGGMNGTSIAPVRSSSSSREPAVIAARVGSDASPTSIATMST